MSTWQRASLAVLLTIAAAGTARAQSPQKRASDLNDQGKKALFSDPPDYQLASDKFRQAIVLSSEGRFYFNLCLAEYQMGDFGGAMMACQAVGGSAAPADDKTKKNASDLIAKIKDQMQKQGMDPNAVPNGGTTGSGNTGNPDTGNPNTGNPNTGNPDTGNPNTGNPNTGNPNTGNPNTGNPNTGNPNTGNPNSYTGQPPPLTGGGPSQFRGAPPPSLFSTAQPSHDYTYTFGGALEFGSGSFGSDNAYSTGVAGVRILGDLLFASNAKVGGEGYIDIMNVGANDLSTNGSLTVVDFGVGLYKHFCSGRLCVTPMGGVHLVGYSPSMSTSSNDYASVGLRLQAAVGYALGSRYEHYLTLNIGGDFDGKPIGTYDVDPASFGLDKGAAMFLVSIGYQYRFNTPFGQTPFFQLE